METRMRARPSLRTLRILRPANATTAAAAVLVGAYLATTPGGAMAEPARLALAAFVAFAFAAAGNVRNDMRDVLIDREAHPERPLVTGELSQRGAGLLAGALYVAAVLAAAFVSTVAFVLVLVALPLMEGYERALKSSGLPGNLAIGVLTAAPFVLGGLVVTAWPTPGVLAVAGLAALATAGREVLKDIEDAGADAAHRRTLPHRIGARRAAWVAAGFLGAAILLSPVPWVLETVLGAAYLPAVAAADACFGTAAVKGFSRPSTAQRLAKAGMLLALVALVIGRAQGGGTF